MIVRCVTNNKTFVGAVGYSRVCPRHLGLRAHRPAAVGGELGQVHGGRGKPPVLVRSMLRHAAVCGGDES